MIEMIVIHNWQIPELQVLDWFISRLIGVTEDEFSTKYNRSKSILSIFFEEKFHAEESKNTLIHLVDTLDITFRELHKMFDLYV